MRRLYLGLFAFLLLWVGAGADPVVGAERTRNLRRLDAFPMLMEYHQTTVGQGRMFFTYPRRNTDFVRKFASHEKSAIIYYADS